MVKVVDFGAPWCGPCKMLAPIIHELKTQLPYVVFEEVNVDAQEERARLMGVKSIPTLIFYKDGVEVSRLNGYQNKVTILKHIELAK